MKTGKRTWIVEYDWISETRFMWMKLFATEKAAREFAATTTDGKVSYMDEIIF